MNVLAFCHGEGEHWQLLFSVLLHGIVFGEEVCHLHFCRRGGGGGGMEVEREGGRDSQGN